MFRIAQPSTLDCSAAFELSQKMTDPFYEVTRCSACEKRSFRKYAPSSQRSDGAGRIRRTTYVVGQHRPRPPPVLGFFHLRATFLDSFCCVFRGRHNCARTAPCPGQYCLETYRQGMRLFYSIFSRELRFVSNVWNPRRSRTIVVNYVAHFWF